MAKQLPWSSKAFVVIEGQDSRLLRQLGDRLVEEIGALGPPWVVNAEDGVVTRNR